MSFLALKPHTRNLRIPSYHPFTQSGWRNQILEDKTTTFSLFHCHASAARICLVRNKPWSESSIHSPTHSLQVLHERFRSLQVLHNRFRKMCPSSKWPSYHQCSTVLLGRQNSEEIWKSYHLTLHLLWLDLKDVHLIFSSYQCSNVMPRLSKRCPLMTKPFPRRPHFLSFSPPKGTWWWQSHQTPEISQVFQWSALEDNNQVFANYLIADSPNGHISSPFQKSNIISCQWVSQWLTVSYLEIAIASPSFASLFLLHQYF